MKSEKYIRKDMYDAHICRLNKELEILRNIVTFYAGKSDGDVARQYIKNSNRKENKLNHEDLLDFLSYDPNTGIFRWIKGRVNINIGDIAGSIDGGGYWQIKLFGECYAGHRLAWLYFYGVWPEKFIDHINGDKTDNRIANLREATQSQNMANSKISRNNTSGIKGVAKLKDGRYRAYITHERKRIDIGIYLTVSEAAKAREKMGRKLKGQFYWDGKGFPVTKKPQDE